MGDKDSVGSSDGTKKIPKTEPTYSSFLHLDTLLWNPSSYLKTDVHDEHLFVLIHQVYELWFKQIIYELDSIIVIMKGEVVDERDMLLVTRRIDRINKIMKIVTDQFVVIETMTPFDFYAFRSSLGSASGFQSAQFRLLENKLGIKSENRCPYGFMKYTTALADNDLKNALDAESAPTMFSVLQTWLSRTPGLEKNGFNFWAKFKSGVNRFLTDTKAKAERIEDEEEMKLALGYYESLKTTFISITQEDQHEYLRKKGERKLSYRALQGALMISLHRDEPRFHLPFQLLTSLCDLDSLLIKWRYSHAQLVQRMIGSKAGTGNSSGFQYLRATCSDRYKVFVDLLNLSTFLIPKEFMAPLDVEMKRTLSMSNSNFITNEIDEIGIASD